MVQFRRGITAYVILAFVLTPSVFSQTTLLWQERMTPFDTPSDAAFGQSIDIDGGTALVGSPYHDGSATDSGAAYVLTEGAGDWSDAVRLDVPLPEVGSRFGWDVAISGPVAVVSAPYHDALGTDAGLVWVFRFDGTNWNQEAQLSGSDTVAGDRFGFSVDVQADRIAVGAPENDTAVNRAGTVYVYHYDGLAWTEEAQLFASNATARAQLGYSVSFDDDVLHAGAPGVDSDAGASYVFRRTGTSWNEETWFDAPEGGRFGHAISAESSSVAIGAPEQTTEGHVNAGAVYVRNYDGTQWNDEPVPYRAEYGNAQLGTVIALHDSVLISGSTRSSVWAYHRAQGVWSRSTIVWRPFESQDYYGRAVALDGDTAWVGADGAGWTDHGAVHRFRNDAGIAACPDQLEFDSIAPNALQKVIDFGQAMAVGEGFVAISAPNLRVESDTVGGTYIYRRQGDEWVLDDLLFTYATIHGNRHGYSSGSDLAASGDRLLIADPGRDASVLFAHNGNQWVEVAAFDQVVTGGDAVALEGDRAFMTAYRSGDYSVLCFERQGSQWNEVQVLTPPAGTPQRDLEIWGNVLVAAGVDEAFVWRHDGTDWQYETTIKHPEGDRGTGFGLELDLEGDRLAIAAYLELDEINESRGTVYTYTYDGAAWNLEGTLLPSRTPSVLYFGQSLELRGDELLIGAPLSDTLGVFSGTAYRFAFDGTQWLEVTRYLGTEVGSTDNLGDAVAFVDEEIWISTPDDGPGAVLRYERELTLALQPEFPEVDDEVTLLACEGRPGNPGMIALIQVGDVPVFGPLEHGPFDVRGLITHVLDVPAIVAGHELIFQALGMEAGGEVVFSKPARIIVGQ